MTRPVAVADHVASKHDRIADAAKFIGRGKRRDVFKEIYRHKKRVKTVAEIVVKTGLTRMAVLQRGGELAREGIVHQTKEDGETAYEQDKFYQANKKKILDLNADRKKLAAYPTKTNPVKVVPIRVKVPAAGVKATPVTIDDIDSFAKAKKVRAKNYMGDALSEDEFKKGIKTILGELGVFKDWGETSDLYSSQAKMNGKRRRVAFAFKGPGMPGKLVPAKMGKNGDQIQRMFQEDADIFFAQHHGQIAPSVLQQMQTHATAKSYYTRQPVYYCVIDGADSERLRLAYPAAFAVKPKKAKPKKIKPKKKPSAKRR